jgi:hypothetical protein
MKKLILISSLLFLFLGTGFTQHNPDFIVERIGFDEQTSASRTMTQSTVVYVSDKDTIGFPNQVTDFPLINAETDSTGYVFFKFNKPYPYFKYINGTSVILMTSAQSRKIASDISDYSIMDSIIVSYEFKNAHYLNLIEQKDFTILDLEGIIRQKDSTIDAHDSILANKDAIVGEKDTEIMLLKEDIEIKNKALNKQKWLIGGSLGVAIAVPLAVLIFGNK